MSKKQTQATKAAKTTTRITQEAPKVAPKARTPKEAENAPKAEEATNASSTEEDHAPASEPAFPDIHSVTDAEHGTLHHLHGLVHADGLDTDQRIEALTDLDLSQNHPVVQKYRDALVTWLQA